MFHIHVHGSKVRFVLTAGLLSLAGIAVHAQSFTDGSVSSSSSTPTPAGLPAAPTPASMGEPAAAQNLNQQAYPYIIQENHSYWHGHAVDLAVGATGRFEQTVTNQQPSTTSPTQGVGVLTQLRAHPFSGFGLEVDYSYNRYSERYYSASTGIATGRVQQDQHEATAGYVFHFRAPYVQPFVVLGGGALFNESIHPSTQYGNQWRGTYMYGIGFDFVSKKVPHLAFRVQEHGLFYKAQDFYQNAFRSNGYVHEAMPSAGLVYRF